MVLRESHRPLTKYVTNLPAKSHRIALAASFIVAGCAFCSLPAFAQQSPIRIVHDSDVVQIQAYASNIVDIHFEPGGKVTPRTVVMDPALKPAPNAVQVKNSADGQTLSSPEMKVVVRDTPFFSVTVEDALGHTLVTVRDEAGTPAGRDAHRAVLIHDENENLYGITGLPWHDRVGGGILRNNGGSVAAGSQGDAGAPFFFTKRYGVLVDSDGGDFTNIDQTIAFGGSRPDVEYFVIVGPPMQVMSGLSLLTGKPPMPPKWSLGFMNSQWGSTEQQWKQITAKYEKEGIPVSAYIMDFDWKAWGESNYGEFRWNSTSGPGNVSPDKFPDGASGKFAAEMLAHGIHLVGIMKPRLILSTPDGQPTTQAQYASDHNFWYPKEPPIVDYFSHRLSKDINFADPAARTWFWQHMEPAFRSGIAGWWNDEADSNEILTFDNFQFLNMGRAEYEGQRSVSNERAWSINRNYYLGAVRYGYAEWSGDIDTGFQSMAYQRRRMIATLDLGEPEWSMDTGGFHGNPTPQNYARWMEFAAFVPIYRVHGSLNDRRQPWVFGSTAEAAAKKAILLRYDLMPYLYSYTRIAHETGIGIVRPLFWEFPDDSNCTTETDAWMFGNAFLVSPIVREGLPSHSFYLPAGKWFDYFSGKPVEGGRVISVTPDATTWQDIPLYVRDGSIVATQPERHGSELSPSTPLFLDVFPTQARPASFLVYDDDGHTYDYEKGSYFRQQVTANRSSRVTDIAVAAPTGNYKPHFSTYLFRIHQAGKDVRLDGQKLAKLASATALQSSTAPGWISSKDRFGDVTEIRLPVDGKQHDLSLAAR